MEVLICVAIIVLAWLAWYAGFSHYNRKRSRKVLNWIEAAMNGHGGVAGVHWRSPGSFLAHLQLRPNACFQQAAIKVALAPREAPLRWLKSSLAHVPESLTFEADLGCAPASTLELHHHRWCGRTRRRLPQSPKGWTMQQTMPLVITTRRDWQREITTMMSALEATRQREVLNVSFRRTSPHFAATLALTSIQPGARSEELFDILQELAGGASASRL